MAVQTRLEAIHSPLEANEIRYERWEMALIIIHCTKALTIYLYLFLMRHNGRSFDGLSACLSTPKVEAVTTFEREKG